MLGRGSNNAVGNPIRFRRPAPIPVQGQSNVYIGTGAPSSTNPGVLTGTLYIDSSTGAIWQPSPTGGGAWANL